MKKFAVALLATAALSMPAVAQQPAQPTNQTQPQGSGQMAQNNGGQPLSPNKLSRDKVRQVQQALDKSGFHAGTADGRWGPETSNALKQFQQSKNIKANGQLDQKTLSGLGLNGAQFAQQNKRNGTPQH
jgi:peptidoglycan hydrolase-like protein with peptidoglycan-binding domain